MNENSTPSLEVMLEVARKAAISAGEIIKRRIGHPASIGQKDLFDYVTDVDREAQKTITSLIKEHFPDHGIRSEEGPAAVVKALCEWIIDPLDGTTNFIHGFPMVAVSIAVMRAEEVVLGLVHDPLRGETFEALRGRGAKLNGDTLMIREPPSLSRALVATGFPFRSKELIEPYLECFRRVFTVVSDVRRAGSAALDLAYVAAGRLSGFWEVGLASWDVAAGGLLVEEAGGIVTDFWGKDNHLQNGHIVAATPSVHGFLLEEIGQTLLPHLNA
jgi:myo-inositol-1(or 4)-monophosphatase